MTVSILEIMVAQLIIITYMFVMHVNYTVFFSNIFEELILIVVFY